MTALEKIRKEIEENPNDTNIAAVGGYMEGLLFGNTDPDVEAKVLDEKKSIKGSIEAMRKEARKMAKGGVAMMPDKVGFQIVRKYFGIEEQKQDSGMSFNIADWM